MRGDEFALDDLSDVSALWVLATGASASSKTVLSLGGDTATLGEVGESGPSGPYVTPGMWGSVKLLVMRNRGENCDADGRCMGLLSPSAGSPRMIGILLCRSRYTFRSGMAGRRPVRGSTASPPPLVRGDTMPPIHPSLDDANDFVCSGGRSLLASPLPNDRCTDARTSGEGRRPLGVDRRPGTKYNKANTGRLVHPASSKSRSGLYSS
jgi:hypothetical protein